MGDQLIPKTASLSACWLHQDLHLQNICPCTVFCAAQIQCALVPVAQLLIFDIKSCDVQSGKNSELGEGCTTISVAESADSHKKKTSSGVGSCAGHVGFQAVCMRVADCGSSVRCLVDVLLGAG